MKTEEKKQSTVQFSSQTPTKIDSLDKDSGDVVIKGCCTQGCCEERVSFSNDKGQETTLNINVAVKLSSLDKGKTGLMIMGCCTQGCCEPIERPKPKM